jgi:hypothetical protein
MRRSRLAADGTTVGIAGYRRAGRARGGELVVAVADDWRGQASLACCSNGSQPGRVPSGSPFTVICLATHNTVIRLLSRLGPTTVGPSYAGLVDVRIDLTGTRPDRCALGAGGRRTGAIERRSCHV